MDNHHLGNNRRCVNYYDINNNLINGPGEAGTEPPIGPTGIGITGPTGPTGPTGGVAPTSLAFGSLRGDSIQNPIIIGDSVPFDVVGSLSGIGVSPSGNELVIENDGLYQITISVSAEVSAEPDLSLPFLSGLITVNGSPIFGDVTSLFQVPTRSSTSFVVQADLSAGDIIGVSISSETILGYIGRSLTVVQIA
ncbi:hypothetical protein [Geomicrobium sp. JCM 19039]|uniref:hypothetical protein n=1 Tax=Geomicrobium sp. JCM 19039 TaxID=1460636 RepID=UPI00045F33A2|nr:hypothetical protein [Geomicrobium sp. JCM 19039]GAK12201.1 flagellar hook-length control protein FliK [Geomicrobium sp. JCM 19039]